MDWIALTDGLKGQRPALYQPKAPALGFPIKSVSFHRGGIVGWEPHTNSRCLHPQAPAPTELALSRNPGADAPGCYGPGRRPSTPFRRSLLVFACWMLLIA